MAYDSGGVRYVKIKEKFDMAVTNGLQDSYFRKKMPGQVENRGLITYHIDINVIEFKRCPNVKGYLETRKSVKSVF